MTRFVNILQIGYGRRIFEKILWIQMCHPLFPVLFPSFLVLANCWLQLHNLLLSLSGVLFFFTNIPLFSGSLLFLLCPITSSLSRFGSRWLLLGNSLHLRNYPSKHFYASCKFFHDSKFLAYPDRFVSPTVLVSFYLPERRQS